DEVVPATQHLLAQDETTLNSPGQRNELLGVRGQGDPLQRIGVDGLVFEIVRDSVYERCEAPERTRQRLRRDGAALVGFRGEARYALEKRACFFARKSVHFRIDVA